MDNNVSRYCTNCGSEVDITAKFCAHCGKEILHNIGQNSKGNKSLLEDETIQKSVLKENSHKCPNCGYALDSFATHCPACNVELRGIEASKAMHNFSMQLSALKNKPFSQKSVFTNLLGTGGGLTETDKQRVILIESFAVPNSIEDLLEFMILASSNINFKLYGLGNQGIFTAAQREISDAWLAKMEQVYQKSKLMSNQNNYTKEIEIIYVKTIKKIKVQKLMFPVGYLGIIGLCGMVWGIIFAPVITIIGSGLLVALTYKVCKWYINKID